MSIQLLLYRMVSKIRSGKPDHEAVEETATEIRGALSRWVRPCDVPALYENTTRREIDRRVRAAAEGRAPNWALYVKKQGTAANSPVLVQVPQILEEPPTREDGPAVTQPKPKPKREPASVRRARAAQKLREQS